MNTSECIINLPAFLGNQFSCTFQSANLTCQNWVITLRSSKFCHPYSKIHNFSNTDKQRNKFTTLIINLCLGWVIMLGCVDQCLIWMLCCGSLVILCGAGFNWRSFLLKSCYFLHGNICSIMCWTVTKISVLSFIDISPCVLKLS
jgi:hypothetical protein